MRRLRISVFIGDKQVAVDAHCFDPGLLIESHHRVTQPCFRKHDFLARDDAGSNSFEPFYSYPSVIPVQDTLAWENLLDVGNVIHSRSNRREVCPWPRKNIKIVEDMDPLRTIDRLN